jgi:hypothetical protein
MFSKCSDANGKTDDVSYAAGQPAPLWFASMAYVMVEATRRLALQATDLAGATSAGSNSHCLGLSL